MINHLAIIVDGNGRWAKNRGLSRSEGHKAGAQRLDEIISYLKLAFYNLKHSGNTYLSVGLIIDYMYELMRLHDQDTIIEYVKKFTG